MTRERFQALAQAYGGEMAHWPAAEREGAALFLAAEPAFARNVLARADELDAALDAWRPQAASHALLERVIAGAPRPRRAGRRLSDWLWRAGLGAGLATACAAGLALGVALSDQVTQPTAASEALSAAADYDALLLPTESA
ncbi:MAG: hypothetical protein ACK41C_11400 [Phenylobacterium sp.]|uniref:hypothetical protein n=1 Tax=Phenylobacterium sp. TaxID=1871053 RepID=UPI00391AE82C